MVWKWWNSNELKIQNSIHDSILGPRCEGSGTTKDLPTLEPRVEARKETQNPCVEEEKCEWDEFCVFEPCLKTDFGTSVNALPNISIKMCGKKVLRTNGMA
ncbi:hypothetical protein AVEN_37813-1 [Araneus ventricosus]|uniref:Uncharacterized protein n=1 Tax=Araneus ventricosus TaxID=182803 RepID=A0A4Y2G422_ARAVE|nr:hypothetical protein AVEN_37813-1 [Araneus ventricosus]